MEDLEHLSESTREKLDKIIGVSNYFFSREVYIITTTTGIVSALSCILVITIILRSQSKLSSPYHRIVFVMCFWDFITSVAIALTTIPMPADVMYPFFSGSSGNERTCSAQGFTIFIGLAFTVSSNTVLNIYHACKIWIGMSDENVKKHLIPGMLIFVSFVTVPLLCIPLSMRMFNPRPFEPYCFYGSYPWDCQRLGLECKGGLVSGSAEKAMMTAIIGYVGFTFFSIVISLALVVVSAFKTEKAVRRALKRREDDHEGEIIEHPRDGDLAGFDDLQTVSRIALMYIGAIFITWVWTILSIAFGAIISNDLFWTITDRCKIIFFPLQGFFSGCIFIYSKILFFRKSNRNETFLGALKAVIFSPSAVPEVLILSIEMVEKNFEEENEKRRIQEQIEADLENNAFSEISPASIPSNFLSLATPSFALSNALSSQGIDPESERERKKNESDSPTTQYKHYTVPLQSQSFIRPCPITAAVQSSWNDTVSEGGNSSSSRKATLDHAPSSSPSHHSDLTEPNFTDDMDQQTIISRISYARSGGTRSVATFGSLLSGFFSSSTPMNENTDDGAKTGEEKGIVHA